MNINLLETFKNPEPGRNYIITIKIPEFTSLCPKTGQPDFGTITIEYVPDKCCIELKSLKLYMQNYRQKGIFYESLVNQLLNDLSFIAKPRAMKVTGDFNARGGITTKVEAKTGKLF
jgi:7-cyano-7-deazaguanine reductase